MGKIEFSNEQLGAIKLRNSSLMVSAAAGSGKTAVLVERIIRKITEENTDIDKLLIVTFTNAAAQGMKKKIKSAIKEKLKNDRDNANLKRQMLLVDKAHISTVHSFCMDLIKKYPALLPKEIPGEFSLMNETEKALMMNQILSEIMSDYYEKNDLFFAELVECYGNPGNDLKLGELILKIYNFLISIPNYERWVEKSLYAISGKEDFYTSDFAEKLFNHIKRIFLSASEKYEFILPVLDSHPEGEAYYEFFTNEYNILNAALHIGNLRELLDYIQTINFERLPNSKKSVCTDMAKCIRGSVKDNVKALQAYYSNEIIEINLKSQKN